MNTNTHSNHRLLKAVSGIVLAGTIAFSATSAFADSGTGTDSSVPGTSSKTVGSVQAKCDAAIAARLTSLGVYDGRLAAATDVTADHRTAVETIITTTEGNLNTLKTEIDAATTLQELRPLCTSIVADNRVYVLVQRQVDLTIEFDHASANTATLQDKATELQGKIDALKAEGKDTTKADADIAKMNGYITAAQTAEAGSVDGVIALTPADYNGNHAILAPATSKARMAEGNDAKAATWGLRTALAIAHVH